VIEIAPRTPSGRGARQRDRSRRPGDHKVRGGRSCPTASGLPMTTRTGRRWTSIPASQIRPADHRRPPAHRIARRRAENDVTSRPTTRPRATSRSRPIRSRSP
jgi:hypothetical protein